jgi:hypothetical protein
MAAGKSTERAVRDGFAMARRPSVAATIKGEEAFMRRLSVILAALLSVAASTGLAAPLDPALQQQLLGVYDGYNKAIAGGKLPDALALRTAETRDKAQKEMKTAKDRAEFLAMAKMMIPDKLEVHHTYVSDAGDKARIITVASKTFPAGKPMPGGPPPGSTQQSEITLSFAREGGAWKLDDMMFGMDPGKIKACKNDKNEPEAAYDDNKTVNMGGPIARVDFQPDYTLVVIRVVDEENCLLLRSSKADLMKHGLDPASLVPYAIVEIEGSAHKTDKQKVLVDNLKVTPEE